MIRFCYEADSGSDVWLMPDEKALQQCDFSSATQICDTDGGSGEDCCNHKVELNDDLKAYLFASKEGCSEGQRAVVTIDDYNDVGDACYSMGLTSSRINKCTCNFEDSESGMSTLSEPCHSQFVAGCLLHSPDLGDDTSCCDDDSCVGKHQDKNDPIGLAIEVERKLLCNDDIPGRCSLGNDVDDCCNSQCSSCGIDVSPFTKWAPCASGNATAGMGNCGYGGHGGRFSQFECDFTKCTEDHKWHMAGEAYNDWMKLIDPDNYVAPTVIDNDDAGVANPGACYDMGSHQCGCGATCNAELCAAAGNVWSAQCPNHCKECNPEATKPDDEKPPAPAPTVEMEKPTPTVEEEKQDMAGSSASVNVMHSLAVAISFGMLVSLS